jgi:hypothetical protein
MLRKFLNKETGNGSGGGAGGGGNGGSGSGGGQGGSSGGGVGGSGGAGAAGGPGAGAGAGEGGAQGGAGDGKNGAGAGGDGAGEGGWGAEGDEAANKDGKPGSKKEGEGDGKTGEADPSAYKLEVPKELSEFTTPESVEAFKAFAIAEKLTPELANKLVKYSAEQAKAQIEERRTFMAEQTKGWIAEIKKDEKLGGANYDATKVNVNRALQHSGTAKELHAKMTEWGINYFPPLVKVLNAYGELLAPDSGQLPGGKGGKGSETLEQAQARWYGTA